MRQEFCDNLCVQIEARVVLLHAPEFILFGLTLAGIALFHKWALAISLVGLASTLIYKLAFADFKYGPGLSGLALHFAHEWVTLTNLLMLLVGFAVLAHHFEESNLPHTLPKLLPNGSQAALYCSALCSACRLFSTTSRQR